MTATTAVPAVITVPATALARLLNDTWRFTSTDPELPQLGAVHLTTVGGYLVARGTDRYALAWSRHQTAALDGFRAAIPREAARRWAEMLADNPDEEATISVAHDGHRAPVVTIVCAGLALSTVSPPWFDVDLSAVMGALLDTEPTALPGVLVDALKLAPFTAVAESRVPAPEPVRYDADGDPIRRPTVLPVMAVTPVGGPTGPLLRVTIGTDFLGVLMGARTTDYGAWWEIDGAEQWRAVTGEQVTR